MAYKPRGKRGVREIIHLHNHLIVVLLETHSQYSEVEKFWEGLGLRPIAIEEARGFTGGIWVLKKDPVIIYVVIDSMTQATTIRLGNAGG